MEFVDNVSKQNEQHSLFFYALTQSSKYYDTKKLNKLTFWSKNVFFIFDFEMSNWNFFVLNK